jgi:hypothetical protein
MILTPIIHTGFDPQRHIEMLKAKRKTIEGFAACTASILARVVDKTMAANWGNYLDTILGFDVDQSIAILEEQKRSQRGNLEQELLQLAAQRDRYTDQLLHPTRTMDALLKKETGENSTPEMIEMFTGQMREKIANIEAQISHIQSQIETSDPPAPAE